MLAKVAKVFETANALDCFSINITFDRKDTTY